LGVRGSRKGTEKDGKNTEGARDAFLRPKGKALHIFNLSNGWRFAPLFPDNEFRVLSVFFRAFP
jgi:hypothetical protein